jgi:secernin
MCDTILATPQHSRRRSMLFGKNSDRQRNEAQTVELFPRADHDKDARLACTYIVIPQERRTHAVLLCRPFWTWGAEMGANEHGVVIGNEGLFARSAAREQQALLGMDLVRLALERASTAAEAVEVITGLLERHGQGGNCGHLTSAFYNNGFMVADASEAYVVETIGREWLAARVDGVRAMSNRYSIDGEVHRMSTGLPTLMRAAGWNPAATGYADAIADPNREHIGNAGARRACGTSLLRALSGELGVDGMMQILRQHGSGSSLHHQWRTECTVERTLCMHAGAEDRPGQTVGSIVSELQAETAIHWVTATAAPCTSIFKPVLIGAQLPVHGPLPTDRFDRRALWWRHEQVHRAAVLGDFAGFLGDMCAERDGIEAEFRARVDAVANSGDLMECSRVVAACWQEGIELEDRWLVRVGEYARSARTAVAATWEKMNDIAGIGVDREDSIA